MLTSRYVDLEVHEALKRFSAETRIPVATYLREAVDDLLKKYKVPPARGAGR